MPGRTLDAILQDALGIKEMVIARLQWMVEDRDAHIADLKAQLAQALSPVSDGPEDRTS